MSTVLVTTCSTLLSWSTTTKFIDTTVKHPQIGIVSAACIVLNGNSQIRSELVQRDWLSPHRPVGCDHRH
ncbi:hypothetical protein [Photorhabdus aegyptia]|uniref:hypothetical protein n=1 Tax=Photorhabdus aegyptia TaxID=2805098 RepID=UPI0012679FB4